MLQKIRALLRSGRLERDELAALRRDLGYTKLVGQIIPLRIASRSDSGPPLALGALPA